MSTDGGMFGFLSSVASALMPILTLILNKKIKLENNQVLTLDTTVDGNNQLAWGVTYDQNQNLITTVQSMTYPGVMLGLNTIVTEPSQNAPQTAVLPLNYATPRSVNDLFDTSVADYNRTTYSAAYQDPNYKKKRLPNDKFYGQIINLPLGSTYSIAFANISIIFYQNLIAITNGGQYPFNINLSLNSAGTFNYRVEVSSEPQSFELLANIDTNINGTYNILVVNYGEYLQTALILEKNKFLSYKTELLKYNIKKKQIVLNKKKKDLENLLKSSLTPSELILKNYNITMTDKTIPENDNKQKPVAKGLKTKIPKEWDAQVNLHASFLIEIEKKSKFSRKFKTRSS